MFLFCAPKGIPSFPKEHEEILSGWDAISDSPVVNQDDGYDGMPYTNDSLNNYQKHMRVGSDSLYNHIANIMRPAQTVRIASIGSRQGLKDMPEELRVNGGLLMLFKVRKQNINNLSFV